MSPDESQPDSLERGLREAFREDSAAPEPAVRGEAPGQVIDRYKLLQPIGEGGMGTVWMAEQREPVVRKVALKIIKLGMDTREVVVRFEAERQALALMEHPHIAKVLDGGATSTGRPYFVMELVRGVPITQYCDQAKLGLRERLELFTKVCEAIQHAHHKGVIHRDIKPSNVLVTLHDGVAVPKVIDFGIAKATSAELTKKTLFTQYAQILGTPEYMAPEQAEMSGLDIDTRADVYSLGVLLYELLTGTKPFDVRTALAAGFQELLRTIREDDPVKPSTRVSTLGETGSPIAANRRLDVEKWSDRLRGDLDWIVMKALEKDRTRRYDTPNGLAEDISRFLRDEAVVAAPPSAVYRFQKLMRRRRKTVIAAATVALLLVLGIVGTSWGLLRAIEERKRADLAATSERDARAEADRKRAEAETNLSYARKANEILADVFVGLDPKRQYADVAELRAALGDNLVRAADELQGSAIGDPVEVSAMQHWLAQSLLRLGELPAGVTVLERALETNKERLGPDHDETLSCMSTLAVGYLDSGRVEEAIEMGEQACERIERTLGPNHAWLFTALGNLGLAYRAAGNSERSIELLERAAAGDEALHGAEDVTTLQVRNSLAMAYSASGKPERALEILRDLLPKFERALGVDHADTLMCMNNTATTLRAVGQPCVEMLERTLARVRTKFGPDHPNTLVVSNNLGSEYVSQRKVDEAIELLEDTLPRMRAVIGPEHVNTLSCANNLAMAYQAARRIEEALPLYEDILDRRRAAQGPDHPFTLVSMNALASGYRAAGQLDRAVATFEDALARMEARLGASHPDTLTTLNNLAGAYGQQKQHERALPLYERALAALAAVRYRHEHAARIVTNAALAFEAAGKLERVEALCREWAAVVKERSGATSAEYASELAYLGANLMAQKKWSDAEAALRECLELRRAVQPALWTTFNTQSTLGGALLAQAKHAEAEPLLLAGYEGMKEHEAEIPEAAKSRLADALTRLVELFTATSRPDEAKRWSDERAKLP